MNTRLALLLLALFAPISSGWAQTATVASRMPAFSSQAELRAFITKILAERARRMSARRSAAYEGLGAMGAPSAATAPMAMAADATDARADVITNNQTAGVDEGGIVKLHGNHLVVLRRGRLFTVSLAGGGLQPAAVSDAFGPGLDPSGAWYDEMLISGDKVVVIGYSYQRGGTEVGVFQLGQDGSLRYVTTFQLRSNDYYSSRNYAARLIGTRLVFYSPLYLPWHQAGLSDVLPAFQQQGHGFQVIARPERVFLPRGVDLGDDAALHTVTSCDLATAAVRCDATVVLGPAGRVFYVSAGSVYVWMSSGSRRDPEQPRSMLVRIPLDGELPPTAVGVAGSPVDQFSFLESDDGMLNVLTRAESAGEAMWSSERSAGQTALLRLPLRRMGDGRDRAPASWYRTLPSPAGQHAFHNRFAGDYLLYGAGNGWGPAQQTDTTLFLVRWRGGTPATLALSHGIDRIEVMGSDAVVVGARGNHLEFTGVDLGDRPAAIQRFVLPNASQGEQRSHGFFYRADGDDSGVLGLPVRAAAQPGWQHLVEGSASIVFLRNNGRRFRELGLLEAGELRATSDGCKASCVDWYGNARPIFARGRIFALLGYELVEGSLRDGELRELRRINFSSPLVAVHTDH